MFSATPVLINGGTGADLFFLPLYMNCGSLALSGRKIGSSIIPRLSLVILLIACLGAAVVVVVVVVDVVVVSGIVVAGAAVEITALSSVKKINIECAS